MKRSIGLLLGALGLIAVAAAQGVPAQTGPDRDAFGPAQTAADIVLASSGADLALLPAGMMYRDFKGNDLSKLFKYPGDTIVVSKITGAKLNIALERSVSLYPHGNAGFLQIAGMTVTFDPDKPKNSRITNVRIGTTNLVANKEYRVAMPISLARGGYGYFASWDKKAIVRTLDGITLESLLKGKKPNKQTPRWKPVS